MFGFSAFIYSLIYLSNCNAVLLCKWPMMFLEQTIAKLLSSPVLTSKTTIRGGKSHRQTSHLQSNTCVISNGRERNKHLESFFFI